MNDFVRNLNDPAPTEEHHAEHSTASSDILLFLFLGLLIGQTVKHICSTVKVPYTPILAIIGLIIGLGYKGESAWGLGAEQIANIPPHTFFLIFLPPLIFESAFSIDWHIMKMEFIKVLILAGPCLVVAAFFTAIVMRWILGYGGDFTFEAALLFGALISATDPVAVVSVLKELGASRTLSTLIEGESLVNDGTAYVMFSVVLELVKGAKFNIVTVGVSFLRLSIGGPAIGVAFGIGASFWLSRIVNNPLLETNMTFV